MSQDRDTNLALFIDFDNVALGARDARQRFDIKLLLQRVLEKGKIVVKKAYADWHYYKEHMTPLHEAAIEMIEIPTPRISGKNSADIKLVVDAMDLCYAKDHIDTFVIVSGDSDFSPLVSKLRENNKRVLGIGVKNSSSNLLIGNCDEFIFYDDIYNDAMGEVSRSVNHVPQDKRDLFDFLVKTVQGLLQESRGVLYSSLIKDTMTRKKPDFNERSYGYTTFGDLLDEARALGLLVVERDAKAGGTWVVQGLGKGEPGDGGPAATGTGSSSGSGKSSRRRRRSGGRGRSGRDKAPEGTTEAPSTAAAEAQPASGADKSSAASADKRPKADAAKPAADKSAEKKTAKKVPTKKAPAKKAPAKKAATKKAPAKKTAKKAPAKKAAVKKTTTKKATKKAPARKAPAKKTATKKVTKKTGGKAGS